jgi:DNA-binding CsgD family transcriptional regulator
MFALGQFRDGLGGAMTRLGAGDLTAILEFGLEAQTFADVGSFSAGILPGLRQLVPCDLLAYNEQDPRTGHWLIVADPVVVPYEGIEARFAELVTHQHPVVQRARTGDVATYMLSDFFSERQLHRLELYQDVYRHLETEDQISFGLLPEGALIGLSLHRPRRNFSDRDRTVLDHVRRYLELGYRSAHSRQHAATLIGALNSGVEAAGASAVVFDRRGDLLHVGARAGELLRAYGGGRLGSAASLPTHISAWLDAHRAGVSVARLTVSGPQGYLELRLLPRASAEDPAVLLVEEHPRCLPPVDRLEELGLTRRQAAVLQLLATGRRNEEIARELAVSAGTVRKHLEHIYLRLGVRSRGEAIARALGNGGGG